MLGIRRQGVVAIDLFQGDPTLFVSDAQASNSQALKALGPTTRHVTIVGQTDVSELARLKSVLNSGEAPMGLRRVTFILATLDLYYAFQDELFRLFPEAGEV